jgi:hypothetical protein
MLCMRAGRFVSEVQGMARRWPLAAAAEERNKLACGSALETGSHGRVCCSWRRPGRQAGERVSAREV